MPQNPPMTATAITRGTPIVGAVLHFTHGKVGLQLRDQRPGIQFPGHVGSFGGAVEPGETPLQALARELREELELDITGLPLEQVFAGDYVNGLGLPAHYTLWVVRDVPVTALQVREGFLCVVDPAQDLSLLNLVDAVRQPVERAIRWPRGRLSAGPSPCAA